MMIKISTVATTPPVFEDKDIIGVPFLLLFSGLFNSNFGRGFFGNPRVNHHLK